MADDNASVADSRRNFAASASTYSMIVAAQMLAPIVITPFLTRSLTVVEFGQSILTVVLAQVLAIGLNAGFPTAVSRLYFLQGEDDEAARGLVLRAGTVIGPLGVVSALALVWSAETWLPLTVEMVLLAALGATLLAVFEVNQALMRSRRQTVAFALWTAVALVSSQVLGLLMVLAGGGAVGFVIGWVAGTAVGAVGSVLVVRPHPRPVGSSVRSALRIGLPAAFYAVMLTLLTYVDRFVLSYLHGPAASGRYQLAYTVGGVGIAALGAVNLAWGPEVLRSLRAGSTFLADSTEDLAVGMLALVSAGVALAPVGVSLLAPADYDRTGISAAACLLLPLGSLQVLHYSRTHLLTWQGTMSALVPASAVVATVHLVSNIVLDGPYRLAGPPIASLLSFGLLAVILVYLARGQAQPISGTAVLATVTSVTVGAAGWWVTMAQGSPLSRLLLFAAGMSAAALMLLRRRSRRASIGSATVAGE